MFLDGGRKPEYPQRTHAYTGRTCKLHTELNLEPSCCEATALTISPPCSPLTFLIYQFVNTPRQYWRPPHILCPARHTDCGFYSICNYVLTGLLCISCCEHYTPLCTQFSLFYRRTCSNSSLETSPAQCWHPALHLYQPELLSHYLLTFIGNKALLNWDIIRGVNLCSGFTCFVALHLQHPQGCFSVSELIWPPRNNYAHIPMWWCTRMSVRVWLHFAVSPVLKPCVWSTQPAP